MAGITFGAAKDSLRLVVDNGVAITDPRVMRRTNEATQELLQELIPVGGMMSVNVAATTGGFLLLPKEMENAIDATLYEAGAGVYGDVDVRQGFYDIVNPFTYLDPSMAHDNPLIDHGLIADPADATILRRSYEYPGIEAGKFVHITGAKRYLPITSDDDYLIIQNVPALKRMIMAIERYENNQTDDADKLKARALEMLQAEVKKHLMDPRNFMRRKANYELDLRNFNLGTMGWTRARLALEVPGAMMLGKEEISRVLERAELRLMECGIWKGCIEEFTAQVVCGHIVMPNRVESILAADLCGVPIPVRSIFFRYLENGPGDWDCSCGGRLEDEGDIVMNDGYRRHKYRLLGGSTGSSQPASLGETTEGDTEGETLTANQYLYIGTHARLVAMSNGLRLEVLDDATGNWNQQSEWTE